MRFDRYIGIDYSGAETPESRLPGLAVFVSDRACEPQVVRTPAAPKAKHWTRREVADWLLETLSGPERSVVGIDHAFSFPLSYYRRYGLANWDDFLADFCLHWKTAAPHTYVDFVRENNPRTGRPTEFRRTDRWTSSAKSVFRMDGNGTVGKSTHAGIPWLRMLRSEPRLKGRVHFWPFDGFEPADGRSVVAEVYPSVFRNRYGRAERTPHQQDAYSTARWLMDMDTADRLGRYFDPPLNVDHREAALREGWILGIA